MQPPEIIELIRLEFESGFDGGSKGAHNFKSFMSKAFERLFKFTDLGNIWAKEQRARMRRPRKRFDAYEFCLEMSICYTSRSIKRSEVMSLIELEEYIAGLDFEKLSWINVCLYPDNDLLSFFFREVEDRRPKPHILTANRG